MEPYRVRQQRAKAERAAAAFNEANPIGTPVRYYPLKGDPEFLETRTRSAAWVMPSPFAVVMIEGKAGGVHIDHCKPIPADAVAS